MFPEGVGDRRPYEPPPEEWYKAAAALGRSFHADPNTLHLFSHIDFRISRMARMLQLELEYWADDLLVSVDPGVRAVAFWLRPNVEQPASRKRLRTGLRALAALRDSSPRALTIHRARFAHRPAEPHWFLLAHGCDPPFQNEGRGSRVLKPMLALCDAERLPAYVLGSTDISYKFYRWHGFESLEPIIVPGSPTLYPLLRAPR